MQNIQISLRKQRYGNGQLGDVRTTRARTNKNNTNYPHSSKLIIWGEPVASTCIYQLYTLQALLAFWHPKIDAPLPESRVMMIRWSCGWWKGDLDASELGFF